MTDLGRAARMLVPSLLMLAAGAGSLDAEIISADRRTTWNPGLNAVGGIPVRTTICATINAATYGNGALDASAGIQAALLACPAGQVVLLSAGIFTVNDFLLINKSITLRGAGPSLTTLQKTNGAVPGSSDWNDAEPLVIIGASRWPHPDESTARNLTADAVKGTFSVTVASASGFAAGQFVILDENNYDTGAWKNLPNRNGVPTSVQIWATDRVVWQKHNPPDDDFDDPFPDALGWFCRTGRPVNELKEIASVAGNTITFTTPIHITYRTSHTAQLTRYTGVDNVQVKYAGLEDLKVIGGDNGAVRFESAAYSWAKNIENTVWVGEAVAVNSSFRVEIRDSYIHDAALSVPGGGAYAISLADAASDVLIENNVVLYANKVMVARSSGAGSVVGYNYMDNGFIDYVPDWQESGINGSHMVGSHHMLFEGNQSFSYDADETHGSVIYHTAFRNHLTGLRRDFPGTANGRTVGLGYGSYWHSVVGNVLGRAGQMAGWTYENLGNGPDPGDPWGNALSIYQLGAAGGRWEQVGDPEVAATIYRHGNFDYLTNTLKWDPTNSDHNLPASLYLSSRPAFFGCRTWPWVTPEGSTELFTLPARERADGVDSCLGLPNVPQNLSASATAYRQVQLGWTDLASNESGFAIERKRWPNGAYAQIGTVAANVTQYTDTSVPAGRAFAYRVRATNVNGSSGPSSEALASVFTKGDLSQDLKTDLLLHHAADNAYDVWRMDGVVRSSRAAISPALFAAQRIEAIDDFDFDQRNDLVVRDTASGAVEFWLMNGVARPGAAVPLGGAVAPPPNWDLVAAADFNRDESPDLLWRNTTSQKLAVWLMNGTSRSAAVTPTPDQALGGAWEVVAALDSDGDANVDLLWYNPVSGRTVVWLLDSNLVRTTGYFTNPMAAGDANWRVLAAGDYGAGAGGVAGTADLVWRNTTSGRQVVWFMDHAANRTSGTFTTPDAPTPALEWVIAGPK